MKDVGIKPYSASEVDDETPVPSPGPEDSTSNNVMGTAKATMDLTAQLDDELGFIQGDTIQIIEVLDSDFAIGECRGKIGMFPLAFVEVLEGNISVEVPKQEPPKSKFRWWEEGGFGESGTDPPSEPPNDPPDLVTNHPEDTNRESTNTASPAQCHTAKNTQANCEQINNTLNDIKTKSNSLDRFKKTHKRSGSYTADSIRSHDAEVTPYGRTLYAFQAENPTELSFVYNEIVTLHRHVDEQWMEGELDGKRGLFPTAYIEVIVDCFWDKPHTEHVPSTITEEKDQAAKEARDKNSSPEPDTEMYGRVLYDFKAENARDLEMQEGDTVTILRKLDDFWFEARHDDGRVGLCPVDYVEVIVSESSSTPPLSNQEQQPPGGEGVIQKSPSTNSLPSFSMGSPQKPAVKPKPALKPKPNIAKPQVVPRQKVPRSGPSEDPRNLQKSVSLDATCEELVRRELTAHKKARPQSEYIVSYKKTQDVFSRSVDGAIPEDSSVNIMSRSASSSPKPDQGIVRPRPVPSRSIPSPPARPSNPPSFRKSTSAKRPPPPRPAGPRPAVQPVREPMVPERALGALPPGADPQPAPVPSRPAPPAPTQRRIPSIRRHKSANNNLIDLSPDNSHGKPPCFWYISYTIV